MAASTIANPGTAYGPCQPDCAHTDCAQLRTIATTSCPLCGHPIGYDRPFYNEADLGFVHALCLETQEEKC